jgi:hypothetical protein
VYELLLVQQIKNTLQIVLADVQPVYLAKIKEHRMLIAAALARLVHSQE